MPLTVEDAQLLRMAAEPPRTAIRMLDRSTAFMPLVALVVIVPPFLVAACAPFESESAMWALKALTINQAESLTEVLIPGAGQLTDVATTTPPLQAWLMALVLPLFPEGSIAATLAVSVMAVIASSALASRWARENAGTTLSFVLALFLAFHSQWLKMAATAAPDALTLLCLIVTGWSLWGHWRLSRTVFSVRLLCAGLAWTTALLSGFWLAVMFLVAIIAWVMIAIPHDLSGRSPQRRIKTVSLLLILITGASLGGWWYGMVLERDLHAAMQVWFPWLMHKGDAFRGFGGQTWKNDLILWILRSCWISGFWCLGVWEACSSIYRRERSTASLLASFMLIWQSVGLAGRLIPGLLPVWGMVNGRPWESFVVLPATYLAALGAVQLIQRRFSMWAVWLALNITVGCVVWGLTGKSQIGIIIGAAGALVLLSSAPLSIGLRRSGLAWSEQEFRTWIQAFVVISALGHTLAGTEMWWTAAPNRVTYNLLKQKLKTIATPDRISLVISETNDHPLQLAYLTRSLFPKAAWSQSVGWDVRLTDTIVKELEQPQSRMLVLEWSRRELRLRADVGTGWEVTQVIDATPYRGRRFVAHLIAPASSR
ncbi:hypothetical protein GC163_22070 [bacterium]|nr:hypothetical protein [bacterium]